MKELFRLALSDFILGIFAGISISFGCIAFLSSANKAIGALFFVVGLFMVCNFKFNLFTGKACYLFDNKKDYVSKLVIIWIGNFIGALLMAGLVSLTRLEVLNESAKTIVETKMNDSLISLFVLGIFCNMMIYLAVEGYSKFENSLAKMCALFFGVSVFVLCGFEHCVADMFYFSFANAFSLKMLGCIVIITLGNIVGGLLIPTTKIILNKLQQKN